MGFKTTPFGARPSGDKTRQSCPATARNELCVKLILADFGLSLWIRSASAEVSGEHYAFVPKPELVL
jgi:hypothetical protein